MDPVSLIMAALAAGFGAAGAGAAGAVSDATQRGVAALLAKLKSGLTSKASDDPTAGRTLDRYQEDPAGYEASVRDLIVDSEASTDDALLDLAKQLLAAAGPGGAQVGKYNVHVTGSQGTVIGDQATVTQSFGTQPPA